MNYILIIKGVNDIEYRDIVSDLTNQYKAKGLEVPIFAYLPQDYAEIEVLWIDREMEISNYKLALDSTFKPNVEDVVRDYARAINS